MKQRKRTMPPEPPAGRRAPVPTHTSRTVTLTCASSAHAQLVSYTHTVGTPDPGCPVCGT